jgi:hypothetical protein
VYYYYIDRTTCQTETGANMKNKNLCLKILLSVTPEQKDEIGAAARRAGMTTSEHIRSRIISRPMVWFEVTYRSSDKTMQVVKFKAVDEADVRRCFEDCNVISVDAIETNEQWKAEVNAREEDARDYAETVNSVRPGGM